MANIQNGSKRQTLLNYTTTIEAKRTVAEIQEILATKGAQSVNVDYDERGNPVAITFKVFVLERPLWFRLPADPDAAFEAMKRSPDVTPKFRTPQQAERACWRILKDWVEAQMALIQLKQVNLSRAFFQYALDGASGLTLYDHWLETQKALPPSVEQQALSDGKAA